MKGILKYITPCKKHGLLNCPNPQCNPYNHSNEIMEKLEKKTKDIRRIKKPKKDDT